MRSMKLLVATLAVAALVAGPVLAQDAMTGSAPASTDTSTAAPAKTTKHAHKHHTGTTKKHHKASTAAPASTTPAAQ